MPERRYSAHAILARSYLAMQDGRRIRILAERVAISSGENFDHPVMEIIDGVIVNRGETAIVFLARFIDIDLQARADVFVLAAGADFLGLQQLDVLHGDFGDAIRALVHVLHFGRKRGHIERLGFRFIGGVLDHRLGDQRLVWYFDGTVRLEVSFGGNFVFGGDGVRMNVVRYDRFVGFRLGVFDGDVRIFVMSSSGDSSNSCTRNAVLLAWAECDSDKIGKYRESGGQRGSGGLGTEQGRQRVRGTARRACGDQVGVSVVQLVSGALQRREVGAEGARNGVFQPVILRSFASGHRDYASI